MKRRCPDWPGGVRRLQLQSGERRLPRLGITRDSAFRVGRGHADDPWTSLRTIRESRRSRPRRAVISGSARRIRWIPRERWCRHVSGTSELCERDASRLVPRRVNATDVECDPSMLVGSLGFAMPLSIWLTEKRKRPRGRADYAQRHDDTI